MVELKLASSEPQDPYQPALSLRDYGAAAKPSRRAKALVVVTLAVALGGVTIPVIVSNKSVHAATQLNGVSAKPVLDDDGDDMRYHWQNPAYAAEQGLQMGAIAVIMGTFAAVARVKRKRTRTSK